MLESLKRTILLVEDEIILAMTEKMQLENFGYAVKTVNTGEKAVEVVNNDPEIDLVLMDINLGNGIDGTEAAGIILKDHDIPIVFVSSHSEREVVEKTEKITSYGYVVKNLSITVLDASIKMAFKLFEAKQAMKSSSKKDHESAQLLENIMQSFPGIIFWKDKNYVYRGCNLALAQSAGFESIKGIIGKSDYDMPWGKFEGEKYREADRIVLEKSIPKMHILETLHNSNDSITWLDTSKVPLFDTEGNVSGLLGVSLDVTESKILEEARRESEEKYRLLHESAGIGIGYYSADGIVLSYNTLAAKHMGGAPEDFVGKSIFDLFSKADAEAYLDRIKSASICEMPGVYEDKVPLPNGDMYFLSTFTRITDSNGHILGIQIISQDITALKNTENRLQQKNEEYEAVNEELRSTTEELQSQNEELIVSEQLLRQSEIRLLQAERVAKIGNWTLQLATKTIIASSGADAIYGIDFQRVPLAEVQNIPLSEYRPILDKALSDLIANNTPYDLEFKIRRPSDGKIVDIHSVATFDKKTNTVFGVIQDVSDFKRELSWNAVLTSRVALAMDSANMAWWEMDIPTGTVVFDKKKTDMLGYQAEDFKSYKDFMALVHPEDSEKAMNSMRNHFSGIADKYETEYRIRSKTGTYKWFYDIGSITVRDANGNPIKVVGIVIDISERKKSEEALLTSEARFRSYFEMPLHGYAIISPEKGWLFINDRLCSMLGYSREEMLNKTWLEMTYSDDIAEDVDKYNRMVSGEIDQYSMHKRYIRKDGSIIWASIAVGCVRNLDGLVDHVVAIIEDITDQKRAEKYITTLLSEKELLLKEVHHRIKNNMNIVSSLLSLQAQAIKEPSAVSALQEAKSKVQSMSILYDKLYRSVDYTELSIKEYLTTLVEEVIANFPNNQNVKIEEDLEDFMLDAKRVQTIGIIINELLTNIMKDAFPGQKAGLITVSLTKVNGHVTISVKDDGVGMPESVSFENSTGFGLQLVHGLTQQLHGTIQIERGNGTKVVLEFDV